MPFLFTCPNCHTSTQVDDCYSGHEGTCVTCGKAIQIPEFGVSEQQTPKPKGRFSIPMFIGIGFVVLILACLSFLLIRAGGQTVQRMTANRGRSDSISNLRIIAAALNAYASDHGTYPPPVLAVGANKHSWRVLILPYLNENALYSRYDFDEAWGSDRNLEVTSGMPAVFQNQKVQSFRSSQHSDYFLIKGPGTLFPESGPLSPDDVTDDAGQTLLLVEARRLSEATSHWTEPIDVQTQGLQTKGYGELGGVLDGGFAVATVDEKGHFISEGIDPLVLGALITTNGGERLADDVLD
ncbi:DUF1559 domain-containing protein [bacterium]|nr:DUF1559 domain-containing protein [bacterium]